MYSFIQCWLSTCDTTGSVFWKLKGACEIITGLRCLQITQGNTWALVGRTQRECEDILKVLTGRTIWWKNIFSWVVPREQGYHQWVESRLWLYKWNIFNSYSKKGWLGLSGPTLRKNQAAHWVGGEDFDGSAPYQAAQPWCFLMLQTTIIVILGSQVYRLLSLHTCFLLL